MAGSVITDDKRKALALAVAQIEKSCGKGSIMRLGTDAKVRVESIPTGAINLDAAIGVGGDYEPPLAPEQRLSTEDASPEALAQVLAERLTVVPTR